MRLVFEIKPFFKARYVIGILCFAYSCVLPLIDVPAIVERLYLYHAITAMPFFVLGMLIKEKKIDVMRGSLEFKFLAFVAFASITLIQGKVGMLGYNFGWSYSLMFLNACLGTYLLLNVCRFMPQRNYITMLASGTFIILGLHSLLWYPVGKLLAAVGITTMYAPMFVAMIVVAILYPLIAWMYKKYPMLLGKTKC